MRIVVVGKSGAGKSSLINYILGQEARETGAGRAVTERGFYEVTGRIHHEPVTLIDSFGIEAEKSERWTDDWERFIARHSYATRPAHWVHAVLYAVSAQGGRLEPFEIAFLRTIRASGLPVIIALTKSDGMTEKEVTTLLDTIERELAVEQEASELFICPVVSVAYENVFGESVETSGRDALIQTMVRAARTMVETQLPRRIVREVKKEMLYEAACIRQAATPKEAKARQQHALQTFVDATYEPIVMDELHAFFKEAPSAVGRGEEKEPFHWSLDTFRELTLDQTPEFVWHAAKEMFGALQQLNPVMKKDRYADEYVTETSAFLADSHAAIEEAVRLALTEQKEEEVDR